MRNAENPIICKIAIDKWRFVVYNDTKMSKGVHLRADFSALNVRLCFFHIERKAEQLWKKKVR